MVLNGTGGNIFFFCDGALIKHRSSDFQKQLGVLLRVNSRSLWVAGSAASFWVAMKIVVFFQKDSVLCPC